MKKMLVGLMLSALLCGIFPQPRAAETETRPGFKEIAAFLGDNNLSSSYLNLQEGITIGKKMTETLLLFFANNDAEKSPIIGDIIRDILSRSGIEALTAKGTGVNRGADNIYTAKSLTFAPAAAQKGFIWEGFPSDPQARFLPEIFPADTEIAFALNYNFDKIYQEALALITKHAPAPKAAEIRRKITALQAEGIDLAKLCADVQSVNFFWAHTGNLDIANLRLGILVRGGAEAFRTLQTLIGRKQDELARKFPGMKITPERLTFPLPTGRGTLEIYRKNGYLVATTIKDEIDALLAGKGKSLSADPVFKATLGDLPATQTAFYGGKNNYAVIKTLLTLKGVNVSSELEKMLKELGGDQPWFCGMGRNANGIFTVARSTFPLAYCERLYGESRIFGTQFGFAAGILSKHLKNRQKAAKGFSPARRKNAETRPADA